MPPKRATSDSRSLTVLFKKHKMTVILSLQPHEPLTEVKEKLLRALKSRELSEINGDPVPDDSSYIELGLPVDRNDPEKGWTRLATSSADENGELPQISAGRAGDTVLAAGLTNGHSVAFRFRKPGDVVDKDELDMDLNEDDPGWDVVIPSFDEEEEEGY